MRDEHRQQLVEQYEEAAISLLMDEYAESEGARLLQEYEAAAQNGELPEIPAELDEKCRQLIDKAFLEHERKSRLKRIRAFAAKVAVSVLVLLGLSTVTVLSVDALRIPVLNFLMDQSGRYSTVAFENNIDMETADTNSTVMQFEINLPDGYKVVQTDFEDSSWLYLAVNAENSVVYLEVTQTEWGLNIDTEDTEYRNIEFGEYTATFQDKNGYHLRWLDQDGQIVYTLFANGLHADIFWEFAYTIAG